MDIKPLRGNVIPLEEGVVVRVQRPPKRGIVIMPEDEPLEQGVVISVGPKVENLSPGDTVLISKYAGATIYRREQEMLLIMKERDIPAKVEGGLNGGEL